jgi:hypothetical protein
MRRLTSIGKSGLHGTLSRMEGHLTNKSDVFLGRLYDLCRSQSDEEDAIDLVFSHLSLVLADGRSEECDAILAKISEQEITPAVASAILVITSGARMVLKHRREVVERFYKRHPRIQPNCYFEIGCDFE